MKRTLVLTSLALALSLPSLSQAKETQNLMKARTAAYLSGPIDKERGILYILGLEYRFTDTASKFEEVFGDIGIGYVIAPGVVIWGGLRSFVSTTSRTDPTTYTQQHPFQQIVWKMVDTPDFALTSRSRVEERYLGNTNEWKLRLRQRFAAEFPEKLFNHYSPLFYNETHFNVGKGYAIPENRTFAGVYIPTSERSKLEVGYMNQQLFSPNITTFAHNLYLTLRVSTG